MTARTDDDPIVRKVGEKTLRHLGYRALLACDGVEGVATFREHHAEIACVILDIVMPRMGQCNTSQVLFCVVELPLARAPNWHAALST